MPDPYIFRMDKTGLQQGVSSDAYSYHYIIFLTIKNCTRENQAVKALFWPLLDPKGPQISDFPCIVTCRQVDEGDPQSAYEYSSRPDRGKREEKKREVGTTSLLFPLLSSSLSLLFRLQSSDHPVDKTSLFDFSFAGVLLLSFPIIFSKFFPENFFSFFCFEIFSF